MHKNFSKIIYSLLIVLFFSSVFSTEAATTDGAKGLCVLKANLNGQLASLPNETESHCHEMADDPANASSFVSWTQNDAAPSDPSSPTNPADPTTTPDGSYKYLAPLPCEPGSSAGCVCNGPSCTLQNFTPAGEGGSGLSDYLNIMLRIFIGVCAVLAVMMVVVGGIEYMTSDLISNKEQAKHRISGAVFGLLLALGSWLLLNQINPDLLKADLSSLKGVTVTVDLGGEGNTPFQARTPASLQQIGVVCGGGKANLVNIAQSFVGRSVYSMEDRNNISNGKAYVDCSSYVSQVYSCAGIGNPGGTTLGIFGSGNTQGVTEVSSDGTSVNGAALKVGDLLGWKQGENKEKWGHVVMYIGNGQVIDAQRSGVAVRSLTSDQFKGRIKYVKRIQ